MTRSLALGNGKLLVAFDTDYNLRDMFYPRIGMENHTNGDRSRLGFWCDGTFAWSGEPAWRREIRYEPDSLNGAVTLSHEALGIVVHVEDCVDFALPVLVRKFVIEPTSRKDVRIFLHLDLHICGNAVGDAAFYDPDARAIVHYKDVRYFLHGGIGANGAVDQFACGQKEFDGKEGTWRDAEDGVLSASAVAQGSVDSVIALHATGDPQRERTIYAWLACGEHIDDVERIAENVRKDPARYIARTRNYWQLWCNKEAPDFGPMDGELVEQFKRSLLTIRTHVDAGGGIVAATDSDVAAVSSDTYSYVWARDGSAIAFALDEAGYHELANRFFAFCGSVIDRRGYFLHRYNADGTLASSWHTRYENGQARLPIQEDETGLTLWALWHHFNLTHSMESIEELYGKLIRPAGRFLRTYVDDLGLCQPSYDLWEERWGIHAFTVGVVYGGLRGAQNFADAFGEKDDAHQLSDAADRLARSVRSHFFDPAQRRIARMLTCAGDGSYEADWTPDAAAASVVLFGMFDPKDELVGPALDSVFERIAVKTQVGGYARYPGDTYFRNAGEPADIPGNPWFVTTLWRARIAIARATDTEELEHALPLLQWAARHALPSGLLSEQVDPLTGAPQSVSPLIWSHAEYVTAFLAYLDKYSTLKLCPSCGRPLYMREHERLHEQHEKAAALDIVQ
ncbi:MAG: glycoside hydrolase family 15 protein [Candidatus Tyrphobacter sp.]